MLELKRIYNGWKELDSALAEINQETFPGLTSLIKDEITMSKIRVTEITDGAIFSLKILEKIIYAYENHQCYPMKKEGRTVGIIYTNWEAANELASAYKAEGANIINVNNNCNFKFYVDKTKADKKEDSTKKEEVKVTAAEAYRTYELDPGKFYYIVEKEEDYPYAEDTFNKVFSEDVRAYIEEGWDTQWNLMDGRNFLISNILSNPDVYHCLKGKVDKQEDLINIISSWWDSLLLSVEGFLEGCDDNNAEVVNETIHALIEEPVKEDGKIKEDKLDEVIDVIFDLVIAKNQDSEFKMFLSQPEIKSEFCKLVRDLSLKMADGASYSDVMAEAMPSIIELMTKKAEA